MPDRGTAGITPAVDADPTDAAGHQVALAPGADTTITIAVTAGDATSFYKIVITRGAAAADASLNTLAFGADVTLVPAFSRHTYSYTATVPNRIVDTVTVTPNR